MQKPNVQFSRRRMVAGIAAALALPRASLAADLAAVSGGAFATTWRLSAAQSGDLAPLVPMIDRLFAQIDRTFSPWRADSTLSRFNASSAGTPMHDTELARVTSAALAISQHSDGAFDPTVGPLVAKWGFGPIHTGGAHDWRGIRASAEAISKTRDDLTLDLCGIAKGHALDRAAALVRAAGFDNFLFELGGEVIAQGQHPDGRDWRLSIDTPLSFANAVSSIRLPTGSAVATSGVWEQSYTLNQRLYSHIIDTRADAPVSGRLRAVTVVTPDAMTADAWATGLCAAGAEGGLALATAARLPALFLIEQDNSLHQITTDPMKAFLL